MTYGNCSVCFLLFDLLLVVLVWGKYDILSRLFADPIRQMIRYMFLTDYDSPSTCSYRTKAIELNTELKKISLYTFCSESSLVMVLAEESGHQSTHK